jgi:hypothetical protein
MNDIFIIQALLRLLDYSAIKKFSLKDKQVNFDDKIGKKAVSINNTLKEKKELDIFAEKISVDDIIRYEHLVSNAISNHVNKKVVLRKVNDEIKLLKESKKIDPKILQESLIKFSQNIDSSIAKIKSITPEELMASIKSSNFLSCIGKLKDTNYFAQSTINLKGSEYFLISTLAHSKTEEEFIYIADAFILQKDLYLKFKENPIQLFLKGLDKYGIDMNLNDTLSRYYHHVTLPLNSNIHSIGFLKLQNIDTTKEGFSLSMTYKKTKTSIEISNVYATKTRLILNEFNK